MIGGGDWAAHRLLPDLVRAFAADQTLMLRMPDAIRPWQHVLEALSGYLMLAQHLCDSDGARFARSWNFGPADAGHLTVGSCRALRRSLGGAPASEVAAGNFQKNQIPALDAALAHQELAGARTVGR